MSQEQKELLKQLLEGESPTLNEQNDASNYSPILYFLPIYRKI